VYSIITELDATTLERVAMAMETSAADPQHRDMVSAYLADLDVAASARVVELGCGTGAIARIITSLVRVSEYVGTDPSPQLLERARELANGVTCLRFEQADGASLPFADASFDLAIVHRVLSHVPDPQRVLHEAVRVVRAGGLLAVFDGDYATTTLAVGAADPLQCCVEAFTRAFVHEPWIVRRLSKLAAQAGIIDTHVRSYGFVQVRDADYMLSIVDRGADTLLADGVIGAQLAAELKAEARRRVLDNRFFGHVAYGSLTGRKPVA
jgi:ubiquinone/menaquinone biosynthesis C-methylase UbiE